MMPAPNIALADALRTVVNAGRKPRDRYEVIPDERPVASIERRTIIVSLQGFEPTTAAPLAAITIRHTVRVLSPKTIMSEADVDAWDAATDVARAIDGIDGATYRDATKVLADKYLAYDITVETDATWKD